MPESTKLLHLLLVEDDEDHVHIIRRSLDKSRVANTLDHVSDGAEALAYLRRDGQYADVSRPDIILLDLKLPKVDGHEVLAKIKDDPALCTIPVVVLTTSASEADRAQAYLHHVNSYVVKPLQAEAFLGLVDKLNVYWGLVNVRPPSRSPRAA